MRVKVEIDSGSGFCYGVIRAVNTAEKNLGTHLYSLGAIVHNNSELERLEKRGLEVIDIQKMKQLRNTSVLIRAHGEPPETYAIAKNNNISLIDCTCPVVLQLQQKIRNTEGQIIIFGKKGHAEVNGLVGQADGRAIVIEAKTEGEKIIIDGADKIDFSKHANIFSQTTKDPDEYEAVCNEIKGRMNPGIPLTVNNTICKQVATRHSRLGDFARAHSVIIFVSGKESSNGKVLYDLCRGINERSYHIQGLDQIKKEWFRNGDKIGICGATSTPKWQLTATSGFLKILLNNYICGKFYRILYGNYRRF